MISLIDAARKAVARGNKVYILPNPKGITLYNPQVLNISTFEDSFSIKHHICTEFETNLGRPFAVKLYAESVAFENQPDYASDDYRDREFVRTVSLTICHKSISIKEESSLGFVMLLFIEIKSLSFISKFSCSL